MKKQKGMVGFYGTLLAVLLILKLVGVSPVANWSWLWILAPFWFPLLLWGIAILIALIFLK